MGEQIIERFQKLLEKKINYSDYKQLAEDCWLFLTNDKMPAKATISKKAFIHEVKIMIELAVIFSKINTPNTQTT